MRAVAAAVLTASVALSGCSSGSSPQTTPATTPATTTPTPSTTAPAATVSWPAYHGAADRAGAAPSALRPRLRKAWSIRLDAAMYAQPIVADSVVFAATENNSVYAADLATGHVTWRRHLEAPARRQNLPCGNIDPSG